MAMGRVQVNYVIWLGLGRFAVLHSSNEPGELSQWLCHDDSTINIVLKILLLLLLLLYTVVQKKRANFGGL